MKTGDLVKHFGVSETTIRRWSTEFNDLLSPQPGKQRTFTSADFLIMATINELTNKGLTMRAIREQLEAGYRVQDTTAQTVGYEDGRLVPAAAVEQIIDATEIRAELEAIRMDRDRLAIQLEKRDQRIEELNQQIQELQYKLGRAEMEAQIRREMEEERRKE